MTDREHSVDSALIATRTKKKFLLSLVIDPLWMLNHQPIHVNNPQCTFGPRGYSCWSKPAIGRCKELLVSKFFRTNALEGYSVWNELSAMNQVMNRSTGERIAIEIFAKEIVAVDACAASGCELMSSS